MGFINKVGHKISKGVSSLGERNRRQAQLNRIRAALKREERAAQIEYVALGKYYYNNLRDLGGEEADFHCKELERIETRINSAVKQLEHYYNEVAQAREKKETQKDDNCTGAAVEAVKNAAVNAQEKIKRVVYDTQEAAKDTAADVEEKVLKAVEEAAHIVSDKAEYLAEAASERRNIQPDEGLDDNSPPEEEPAFANETQPEDASQAADSHENDDLPFAD